MKKLLIVLLFIPVAVCAWGFASAEDIVLFVTSDGLRWQEVFDGAEPGLIGAKDTATRQEFLRDQPEARREALMPFLWKTVAKQGQIYGNQAKGSIARVTNGRKFSYPGYQELLAGFPDPRIDSNDKIPNPNTTVLEWLNRRPEFEGKVAAFGTWDVLPFILNRARSGLHILAADEPIREDPLTDREAAINDLLRDTTPLWEGNLLDSFAFHASLDYLKRHHPRVLYVQFGETDEWAHEGNYRRYLLAARNYDRFLQTLWETAQAISPGRVSLIATTDHGRGSGAEWRDHGEKIDRAEGIWIAVIGPRVAPLGERTSIGPVTQSQVAPSVAALAGENYSGAVSKAAKPLPLDR